MSKEAVESLHKQVDRLFAQLGTDHQFKVTNEKGVSKYKNKALSFVFLSYHLNNLGFALTDETLKNIVLKRGYDVGRGSALVDGYASEIEILLIFKPLATNS